MLTNSVPEFALSEGAPLGEPKPPLSTLVMAMYATALLLRCVGYSDRKCGALVVVVVVVVLCIVVKGEGCTCGCIAWQSSSSNSGILAKPCVQRKRDAPYKKHNQQAEMEAQCAVSGPAVFRRSGTQALPYAHHSSNAGDPVDERVRSRGAVSCHPTDLKG